MKHKLVNSIMLSALCTVFLSSGLHRAVRSPLIQAGMQFQLGVDNRSVELNAIPLDQLGLKFIAGDQADRSAGLIKKVSIGPLSDLAAKADLRIKQDPKDMPAKLRNDFPVSWAPGITPHSKSDVTKDSDGAVRTFFICIDCTDTPMFFIYNDGTNRYMFMTTPAQGVNKGFYQYGNGLADNITGKMTDQSYAVFYDQIKFWKKRYGAS